MFKLVVTKFSDFTDLTSQFELVKFKLRLNTKGLFGRCAGRSNQIGGIPFDGLL